MRISTGQVGVHGITGSRPGALCYGREGKENGRREMKESGCAHDVEQKNEEGSRGGTVHVLDISERRQRVNENESR